MLHQIYGGERDAAEALAEVKALREACARVNKWSFTSWETEMYEIGRQIQCHWKNDWFRTEIGYPCKTEDRDQIVRKLSSSGFACKGRGEEFIEIYITKSCEAKFVPTSLSDTKIVAILTKIKLLRQLRAVPGDTECRMCCSDSRTIGVNLHSRTIFLQCQMQV